MLFIKNSILLLSVCSVCMVLLEVDIVTLAVVALLRCVEVSRHAPRVVFLEYVGAGAVDTTLMLVGKVCICGN